MADPERAEPELVTRLRARREAYESWSALKRYGFLALGFVVLIAGVAMLALPGPAFVVIPIGLVMLSFEFAWAERLLERAIEKGVEAQHRAAQTTTKQRVLAGSGLAVVLATVVVLGVVFVL